MPNAKRARACAAALGLGAVLAACSTKGADTGQASAGPE